MFFYISSSKFNFL